MKQLLPVGKSIAFKEKDLFAAGMTKRRTIFSLTSLCRSWTMRIQTVLCLLRLLRSPRRFRKTTAKENAFVAKYAEKCDARFLEYSLKENEKREKAKAERRKKKLQALGLKESQVDPDITAWKDLEEEGGEEKNSEDPSYGKGEGRTKS